MANKRWATSSISVSGILQLTYYSHMTVGNTASRTCQQFISHTPVSQIVKMWKKKIGHLEWEDWRTSRKHPPQISLGKSPLLYSQSRPHLSGSTWPDTVSQNAVSSWLCHTVQWWMGTGPKPAQWESVLSAKLAISSWSCRMPGGSWPELSHHLCVTTNQRMNPHQRRAELREGVRQYLDDII